METNLLRDLKIYQKPDNFTFKESDLAEDAHITVTNKGRFYFRKDIVMKLKLLTYPPSFGFTKTNNNEDDEWYLIVTDDPFNSFNVNLNNDSYFIHCTDIANRILAKARSNRVNLKMVATQIPQAFKLEITEDPNRARRYNKEDVLFAKDPLKPKAIYGHDDLIKGSNYYDHYINSLLNPKYD